MNLNRLLTFPLTQCSVRARRLEMLQLSHSGCSCLLCLTFIGNINASTDHRRQISNVVGNGGYNFSVFWSKALAGTCGSELWLSRGWCPLVGRDPSEPSALVCSQHIPPPLPLHFLHPFPLSKILPSWPFSSVPPAVADFSSPFPPFPAAPEPPCPAPLPVVLHHPSSHTDCSTAQHSSQPLKTSPQQTVKSAC